MTLELAEDGKQGYTFVPFNDETTEGAYVRNDVLQAALNEVQAGVTLNGFFDSLWSGIKKVAGTVATVAGGAIKTVVGGVVGGVIGGSGGSGTGGVTVNTQPGTTSSQQPIIIQQPAATAGGMDSKTMLMIGGGLLAAILLLKK